MNIKDLLVVEWCQEQQCEHYETLGEWLSDTQAKVIRGERQEWQLVGVFDNEADRSNFGNEFNNKALMRIKPEDRLPITLI